MATTSPEPGQPRPESRPREPARASSEAGNRLRRVVPGLLGAGLLLRGLRRRSLGGMATASVGGWLVYRALGGPARLEQARRPRTASAGRPRESTPAMVTRSVTISQPADTLYEAWRDPDQFSQVMGHFAEVTAVDEDHYRWTVHLPGGREVSWETRIVEAEPGERLRWETAGPSVVAHEGSVRFRPASGDRGTVVTLSVRFDPPGGPLGRALLDQLEPVPGAVAGNALRRFKSLVETGEIATLEGNPSARGRGDWL